MEHSEAVQQMTAKRCRLDELSPDLREMAAERYLLNELSPELRDAFEEHLFDCPECALDVRAEAAFLDEAKLQLPGLVAPRPSGVRAGKPVVKPVPHKRDWLGWIRPMFSNPLVAGPVFATLLAIVGYQNLVTYPELRAASEEPTVMPVNHLSLNRDRGLPVFEADHKRGVELQLDLPDQVNYPSYSFSLKDAEGKLVWTSALIAANSGASETDGTSVSLNIPGAKLKQGSHTLILSGVSQGGQSTAIERHSFDIHFKD